MQSQQPVPAPDEIWRILKELSVSQKRMAENWEKQQKTRAEEEKKRAAEEKKRAAEEKKRAEAWEKKQAAEEKKRAAEEKKRAAEEKKRAAEEKKRAEAWEKQRRELAEDRKKLREELAESSKRVDQQIEETNRAIRESDGRMDNRWGDFVESLTVGNLTAQLRERGIMICHISQNETGSMMIADSSGRQERKNCEIDIVAKNGDELVAVEVKSSLDKAKVNRFLYVLDHFHEMFPSYRRMRIRGAVAYLSEKRGAAAYAESRGLFVIKAVGDSSHIINKKSFKPKIFCSP